MEYDVLCHIPPAMRASRLLQMLLLLQNRGRMTAGDLARELEVAPRTILRDVDALTEAGLPVVVQAGYRGGIALGFEYRSRLTGLAADEAEALGVLLTGPPGRLRDIGMADAAARAGRKLLEALPDPVRQRALDGAARFRLSGDGDGHRSGDGGVRSADDPRLPALAAAIRGRQVVRLRAFRVDERVVHPVALVFGADGWLLEDAIAPALLERQAAWGDINVSAKTFPPPGDVSGAAVTAARSASG